MSKKSKRILAYLMFVAALCGTPAVSEARGSFSVQVETEKASTAQRGNLSQSVVSYLIRNYGLEAIKWILLGGGGFGVAKVSKVGNLNALARYALGIKDANSKELDKEKKELKEEKNLFEKNRAEAIKYNDKLLKDKNALTLKNAVLVKQADENKKTIEELGNYSKRLSDKLKNVEKYNKQLVDLTNKNSAQIGSLLSRVLNYRISEELVGSYNDQNWEGAYSFKQMNFDLYCNSNNIVEGTLVEYDADFNVVGKPRKLNFATDSFLIDVVKEAKALLGQNSTKSMIALKDVGLNDYGIPRLARFSFVIMENEEIKKIVAAYFPVKSVQIVDNAENNENGNNGNNVENNNVNNENENDNKIENNQNVNENGEKNNNQ